VASTPPHALPDRRRASNSTPHFRTPPRPRASPPVPPGSSSCASPAAGGRKDARDVAAGRAFICDKSGLALDRGNRHHLFHRGLTTRARKGASPLRQIGHDTFQQMLTTINAPQFRRLRPHGPFTAGRFLLKYMPARGRGRPARVSTIRAALTCHPPLFGRPLLLRPRDRASHGPCLRDGACVPPPRSRLHRSSS
jgi:hypothetical protein